MTPKVHGLIRDSIDTFVPHHESRDEYMYITSMVAPVMLICDLLELSRLLIHSRNDSQLPHRLLRRSWCSERDST